MPNKPPVHQPPGAGASRRATRLAAETTERYTEAHRFYNSQPWRRVRRVFLEDNPLCQDCEEQRGKLVPSEEAHHVVERLEDPSRAFDPTNLRALCKPCHSAYSKGRKGQRG